MAPPRRQAQAGTVQIMAHGTALPRLSRRREPTTRHGYRQDRQRAASPGPWRLVGGYRERSETRKSRDQPKPIEGMLKGIGAAAEIEESLPLGWACRFPIGGYEPYASSRKADPVGPRA